MNFAIPQITLLQGFYVYSIIINAQTLSVVNCVILNNQFIMTEC